MVLTRNVIATFNVTSYADCLFQCTKSKKCQSYNYQNVFESSQEEKLYHCELNSNSISSCPLRKVRKEGYDYFEDVDIPKKEHYGTETNPGLSCSDISSCYDNDGDYWVSSGQTSWNVVRVFCYMNIKQDVDTINLAYMKPVAQTPGNDNGGPPSRAVDGNRNTDWYGYSCTHTLGLQSPWWRVDLKNVYFIRKIFIVNRSDCCSERLSNFEIRIGTSLENNGNSNPTCGGKYSMKDITKKNFTCPQPMIGRYVNIIIPGPKNTLTLCEVEVYP